MNAMKFFLDTANLNDIREGAKSGLIDGITTNPSLVAKESRPFHDIVREIATIINGSISAEVISTQYEDMIKEARPLLQIGKQITIKVPLTPDGLRACQTLSSEGHKVNVTLCFSANQALLAAKAGATFISPFIGRLDDVSVQGMKLIEDIVRIYKNYNFKTEILAASIRHPEHILAAALAGAHVATMPYSVFQMLYKHPLTDIGLEKFLSDWKKVKA